jgi:hypothetical protein
MTPEIYTFFSSIRTFLRRHHPIFFFSFLGILLAIALLSLYQVLSITAPTDNTSSSLTDFDKQTVSRIKNLHDSKDSTNTKLTLPSPRANPFLE